MAYLQEDEKKRSWGKCGRFCSLGTQIVREGGILGIIRNNIVCFLNNIVTCVKYCRIITILGRKFKEQVRE